MGLRSSIFQPVGYRTQTREEELQRRYLQFSRFQDSLDKFLYLNGMIEENAGLFADFAKLHIHEVLPIVYTPTIGSACQNFSIIMNRFRGIFVSEETIDDLESTLNQMKDVQVIVVTDGERILGLGDLGVGGMGISMGKTLLYSLFSGIDIKKTLPIVLDVGTNTSDYLHHPHYMGVKKPRIKGAEYEAFIDRFIKTVKKVLPNVLLQWEDFAKDNARSLLKKYQHEIVSFNDDIQGTAGVVMACLLSAVKEKGSKLENERILFVGAGSANLGIAGLIVEYLEMSGVNSTEAMTHIALSDSKGLVTTHRSSLSSDLAPFAKSLKETKELLEMIHEFKPTILIGASMQAGIFNQEVIEEVTRLAKRPIIMALSNPTSKAECTLMDAVQYSDGSVIFASGSPFAPFTYKGKEHYATQANNLYIFPAMGLMATKCRVKYIPTKLFVELAIALSEHRGEHNLLPPFETLVDLVPKLAERLVQKAKQLQIVL
ncbi:MAG: oxaloacetate-decarboxylating malate dehydrogenase [Chlamydiia bacterium]